MNTKLEMTNMEWVVIVLLLFFLLVLSGCVSIGNGNAMLIKYVGQTNNPSDETLTSLFPNFVTTEESKRIININNRKILKSPSNLSNFESFMTNRYGSDNAIVANLGVSVRDRTTTPSFLPTILTALPEKLVNYYTSSEGADLKNKKLQNEITASFTNIPDLPRLTTLKKFDDNGRKVFHYYPRIAVDFSAQIATASNLDRFSYLGVAIELNNKFEEDNPVKFIDFEPKAANIIEFTRGTLTQNATLAAKATQSRTSATKRTEQVSEDISNESNLTDVLNPDLSLTLNETFINELKDSIETQASGILNNGQIFISELRAIKQKRIGGTYAFDLMIEVPSMIESTSNSSKYYSSEPVIDKITADIYLIGVVRHVYKRGYTGWFTRVPESENDHVFEQVVVKKIDNLELWQHQNNSWVGESQTSESKFIVNVFTNHENARFYLLSDDKVVDTGSGIEDVLTFLTTDIGNMKKLKVIFLPVIGTLDTGVIYTLSAQDSSNISVKEDDSTTVNVIGKYLPKQ